MSEHLQHALWLVPGEAQRRRLGREIRSLAGRFAAPRFAPHITVSSGLEGEPAPVGERLAKLARATAPIELEVSGVEHSPVFFQTLFLVFADDSPVRELRRRVHHAFAAEEEPGRRPHLSLLYHHLDEEARERLAAEIAPPRRLRCDRLELVAPGGQDGSWLPVESWRHVTAWPLAGH